MSLLAEAVQDSLREGAASDWTVSDGEFWYHAQPADYRPRIQGWKLHVSATPDSALEVTRRAAAVLIRSGCAFKVARGLEQVAELLSKSCDRGSGGKVITVYPNDDTQFVRLAELLDEATRGLAGPVILSDRPFLPGSLVHYRYGAFSGRTVLGNDGSYESMLVTPDGNLVKDERLAWYSPPAWATCPLDDSAVPAVGGADGVLLADRFEVRHAIRHGNCGGVFLGLDRRTGDQVVIKQARPNVGALPGSGDVQDLLRHEWRMLQRLAGQRLTPRPIELFEQQGHLFLAQELIAGSSLGEYVHDGMAIAGTVGTKTHRVGVVDLAERLVSLVDGVHGADLVIRDISPNNVMVTPSGQVVLIDLEFIAEVGAPIPFVIGTPGYIAPEVVSGRDPRATVGADCYSLGALLFFLTSGVDTALNPEPGGRPASRRLTALARQVAWRNLDTRRLAPAILGLLAEDPVQRWDLQQVRKVLRERLRPTEQQRFSAVVQPDRLPARTLNRLIRDGLRHLVETMQPDAEELWPLGAGNPDSDPRNLQHGAAGVLAVLAEADDDPALEATLRTAAHWLAQRLEDGPRLLPGLYFGASGAIWALHDAARRLRDPVLAARATALAESVAVRWPNPDICHGAAGAGLAQLHLWRTSGHPALESRVRECADALLGRAEWRGPGVCWPIPADFDSALAGVTHHGFAHGTAGIGAFLLAAGQATGDRRYREMAHAAGAGLVRLATWDRDCAWWPTGEESDGSPTRMSHWCSGSSGIGTFLIRLWRADGHSEHRRLAMGAARAVRAERWRMGTAHCHGIAGDGHYLLDLAQILADGRYRVWAAELGAGLAARATVQDGRLLVPDETGNEFSAAFGTGCAGVLSFLIRLRDGGPRPWMVGDPR